MFGDSFDLFDATGGGASGELTFSGTFASLLLPALAAPLSWDSSRLGAALPSLRRREE